MEGLSSSRPRCRKPAGEAEATTTRSPFGSSSSRSYRLVCRRRRCGVTARYPGTFNYPAFTIEANYRIPVRVKWINQLVDSGGNFLPHLLPVDPALHCANPPGGTAGRDTRPTFTSTPGPYTGPVPIVTHLHGGTARKKATAMPRPGSCPRQTTSRAASPKRVHGTVSSRANSRESPA
jgi:hypothetical protein